jgi:predicted TPR repeat methyltransferase
MSENTETEQVKAVREYYLHDNDGEPSIYHIWERGAGRGDVTTPATSSVPYRQYMIELLRELLTDNADQPGLLSIGCGNGMIEAELASEGFRVLGMDAMPHAVELARAKGLDAVCADVLSWTPPTGPWNVIYADGSLGHLYDPATGLGPVLDRFKSWLPERGVMVLSNDPPRTDAELQENPGVAKYYWFSQAYLHQAVEAAGFSGVTSTAFTYQKPVSGPRDRIVVTGRV